MSEEFTASMAGDLGPIQTLQKRIRQIWVVLAVFGGASILCFCLLVTRLEEQSRALNRMTDDVIFGRFIHYEAESDDYVKPVIDAIQFFHDGYSVQFSTVQYTSAGLSLSGEIGNPNQYRVSDLNLNFAARPYPVSVRDKWDKSGKTSVGWPPEWDIGRAQTRISRLEPGHTARFNVTIPNVKQVSEPIRIAILFSGERYTYPNGH